jgi:hypothetical protein
LKCVQKCRIVQYGQQRHIMDEKKHFVYDEVSIRSQSLQNFQGYQAGLSFD